MPYAIPLKSQLSNRAETSYPVRRTSPTRTTMILTPLLALGLALLCAASPCLGLGSGGAGASVSSVVTEAFFDGIKSQAGNGCEGKNFYTRSAFVSAADAFPAFAHGGTEAEGKREIAAFFAHVTYETGCKSIAALPPIKLHDLIH